MSVPAYYYKVILDYTEPEIKGIGFIMPNKKSGGSVEHYAVTIDSVEHFTGIDFYSGLGDSIEERVEKRVDVGKWGW